MEAVSLETLPPEDSDLYIPNIPGVQIQNAISPTRETSMQPMQLSTVRCLPSSSTANAAIPPPLVAAQGPGSLIQGIYRTTFTTQVIAAQTFHYPPTPPIDGHTLDREEKHHLQQASSDCQVIPIPPQSSDLPLSAGLDKLTNPFPSLPTPPDMDSLHQHNRGVPQLQRCESDDLHNSMAKMILPNSSGSQQQWSAQQTANICFIPPAAAPCGTHLVPYSGHNGCSAGVRRGCTPGLQQMCYSAAVSNPFNDQRYVGSSNTAMMGDMLKKIPSMPSLVKDGKDIVFYCS